jgi:hypothetical protein
MPLYIVFPFILLIPILGSLILPYLGTDIKADTFFVLFVLSVFIWMGRKSFLNKTGLISLSLITLFAFLVAPGHLIDSQVLWAIAGFAAIGICATADSLRDTLKTNSYFVLFLLPFSVVWLFMPMDSVKYGLLLDTWHIQILGVSLVMSGILSWTLFPEKYPKQAAFFAIIALISLVLSYTGYTKIAFIALPGFLIGFTRPAYRISTLLTILSLSAGLIIGYLFGHDAVSISHRLPLVSVNGPANTAIGLSLILMASLTLWTTRHRTIWVRMATVSLLTYGILGLSFGLISGPGYLLMGSLLGAFLSEPFERAKLIKSDVLIQEIISLKRGRRNITLPNKELPNNSSILTESPI